MDKDDIFMRRAFELAALGLGSVSPNPLVGCVVVVDDRIIGEGWHQKFGGPHAEVKALETIVDESLLSRATMYVNLEPCSHYGKTPPCADLIVKKGVRRVVISNRDTSEKVAGKGIERLSSAGIEVTEGILEREGRFLNRRFFTQVERKTPFIILKWAESADGFMAVSEPKQAWISSALSRQMVHQWRSEEDAVLIGTNTAAIDNPRLSVRDWTGRNPIRVVIDRSLRLPDSLNLFDRTQPTICYNQQRSETSENLTFVKLNAHDFISELLSDLVSRNVGSVIVEGGARTLEAFIESGYWHEARVFRSTSILRKGIPSPRFRGLLWSEYHSSGDSLDIYGNPAY